MMNIKVMNQIASNYLLRCSQAAILLRQYVVRHGSQYSPSNSQTGLLNKYNPSTISSVKPQRLLHFTARNSKKAKVEPSSEPYRFTTSNANMKSLTMATEQNEYQGLIVAVSLSVFLLYFLYFREENDLDDTLSVSLFERVPKLEEPHLAQAIPRMREKGEDTTEAEARLKELIQQRHARENSSSSRS